VPDEIWIDNGKDLVAHHVYQLAEGLGIKLVPGPPHEPQIRGIVERLHETLDTRLWSTLPGYVGSNVVERNPKAKAELTITQLNEHFRAFIDATTTKSIVRGGRHLWSSGSTMPPHFQ
jgi:transposase InsO family protein